MLYPTITELTKDEFNRYELALATAKCARIITDEYVAQKVAAEEAAGGNKETERTLINNINKEYRDEKAVKNAITKLHSGEYKIIREELTEEEDEVVLTVDVEAAAAETAEETTEA